MRAMKDSGIEWIGEIPTSWGLKRLKFFANFNPATELPEYSDTDIVSFIPMDHLKAGFHNTAAIEFQKVKNGYVTFQDNDILMAKVTPCLENGNLAIAKDLIDGFGFGSTEINVIRCNDINRQYLFYLLQCPGFIEKATYNMFGVAGLKRLEARFIPDALFPIPTIEEQQIIVTFLNSKCAEIDALIAAKEKTNALLKERRQSIIYEAVTKGLDPTVPMKDSGVEWIGEIPEGWDVLPLKHCIKSIESGTSVNAEDRPCQSDEKGVLKTSCVYSDTFIPFENKAVLDSEYNRLSCPVKMNTVIVSRMNTSDLVGACGYVDSDYDNIFLPDRLWMVFFKEICLAKYMWYFLSSRYAKSYYASICTGTSGSMQNISQDQFGRLRFLLPTLTEQVAIVDGLDKQNAIIDALICTNDQEIQRLREYRQSLIYEAVTGKIEV